MVSLEGHDSPTHRRALLFGERCKSLLLSNPQGKCLVDVRLRDSFLFETPVAV
jgi:hypothetical protein